MRESADPEFMRRLVDGLGKYDLVLASKREGSDDRGLWRVTVSILYNILARAVFPCVKVKDIEGFKGTRKSKVGPIIEKIESRGHTFDLELVVAATKQGLHIGEVPIRVVKTRSRYLATPRKFLKAVYLSFSAFYKIKRKYG